MKIDWYRADVAFKLRMAYLGEKLTYEERLQRVEELLWMRDELLKLVEQEIPNDTQTVYDASKTSETTADSAKAQLECTQSPERQGYTPPLNGADAVGSRGSSEGGKCVCENSNTWKCTCFLQNL